MVYHVAVSPVKHKELRILQERSEEMGDDMMCCISFPEEFRRLQAHYPIMFQLNPETDQFLCLALFGFENGENLFLRNGRWDARYIPLAMDVLPFMIGMPQSDNEERKVVLDMNSPRIGDGVGERLFDSTGVATTYLDNISKKLAYLDDGFKACGKYVNILQKFELLEPLSIDVTTADGSQNRLAGFYTIHEEKFLSLGGEVLDELQKSGYLLPTYMVLASLSNLTALIDRKEEREKYIAQDYV